MPILRPIAEAHPFKPFSSTPGRCRFFAALMLSSLIGPVYAASTTPDAILEVNVSSKSDRVNGQPAVAVNPTRPENLVLVATNHLPVSTSDLSGLRCFAAHSMDGGATWTEAQWPYGDRPSCGDPYLAVDSAGTFFTAFNSLCSPGVECPPGPGFVSVARSTDGGATWQKPVDTTLPRSVTPRLRIDSETDYVYAVGGLGRGDDAISVAVSKDHGETWGPRHVLPMHPFGNQIAVHAGILATATSLVVVDNKYVDSTDVKLWISSNDGVTFESHPVTDSAGKPVAPPAGNLVPSGKTTNSETLAMTDPIPLVSADPSARGRFAILMPRNENLDIYLTGDAGKSWTGPTVIKARDAAKPWMEFGENGDLGVMWRTFREGMMDVYATVSFDGGSSFSQPLKVNLKAEPYTQIQSGGDEWSRIILDPIHAYVSWSDSRGGKEIDSIVARVPLDMFRAQP